MTHGHRSSAPARMTEDALDRFALDAAKTGGWDLAYHTHRSQYSPAGFPDRVFIHTERGLVVVAELKGYDARGRLGLPSPEQLDWLAGWRAAGVPAFLWVPDDTGLIADVLMRRLIPPLDELPPLPAPRRGPAARSRLR